MGSLTVAKEGKVLYVRSIGYSQIDGTEKKSASAATRYRIGSVTKIFTARSLLMRQETFEEFFHHYS